MVESVLPATLGSPDGGPFNSYLSVRQSSALSEYSTTVIFQTASKARDEQPTSTRREDNQQSQRTTKI